MYLDDIARAQKQAQQACSRDIKHSTDSGFSYVELQFLAIMLGCMKSASQILHTILLNHLVQGQSDCEAGFRRAIGQLNSSFEERVEGHLAQAFNENIDSVTNNQEANNLRTTQNAPFAVPKEERLSYLLGQHDKLDRAADYFQACLLYTSDAADE